MQEVHLIENSESAGQLLRPIRIRVLTQLAEPLSCPEIGRRLNLSTQKIYYHVKVLQKAGLVRLVEERRKRGIMEGVYQAVARSIWFSPRLVARLGGQRAISQQASLAYLLQMAEELQIDIGHLAESEATTPFDSLAIDARIQLRDSTERSQFLNEVKNFFQQLAHRYGAREDDATGNNDSFRLMMACYPTGPQTDHKQIN